MSLLARLLRKGPNDEALAQNFFAASLYVDGTLGAADDQVLYVLPVDARLVSASMYITANGATSGATTLSVETLADNTDLTGAQLSLAHDSAVLYDSVDETDANFVSVEHIAGDVFTLCIDAVPGTASTDLTVILGFVTI